MPQSLSSILIHLVFSTKNREPFITPEIESELHPYMASIFRDHKSPSLIIDGTMDHVHILFNLGRSIAIADLVEEVKTGSSKWIKTKGQEFRNFHWQKGYGAFSIGNQMSRRLSVTRLNSMNDMFGIDYSAPSALALLRCSSTWAVGPGYYMPRLWR